MKQRLNDNVVIGVLTTLILAVGCKPYEDFVEDFDFSIVYFGTQKPLRTIVAYEEMSFKVGVALGGKRTNAVNETVNFEIDPSLLDDPAIVGGNPFELMPSDYYEIDGQEMVVPVGKFIGDVTVKLNTDLFTADPKATQNHYAIPIRIKSATTDSVATGAFDDTGNVITVPKDYTIVVVKYISPLHGTYYRQGVQKEFDEAGAKLDEITYNDPDLIKNATWDIQTVDRYSVSTPGFGTFNNGSLLLSLDSETNQVTISTGSPAIVGLSGQGTYDPVSRVFQLDYSFERDGRDFQVSEKLTIRQAPELDLRFEEW